MTKKTKILKICLWVGLVVALLASLLAVSFSWYTDKKDASMNITISGASGEATISEELKPEDLVAGNSFVKSVAVNFKSKTDVYFRAYATVVTQTLNGSNTITKTDVVLNNGVDSTIIGTDGRYYYSTTNANSLTSVQTQTVNVKFSFLVSSEINDEILRDSSGNLKKDLKTTITYHVEYCQKENFAEWGNITSKKTNYLITFKQDSKVLKTSYVEYGQTPSFGETNPTKQATSEKEYVFSAWSPAISAVTKSTDYTATFTEKSFVATFDANWQTQIAGLGIDGISAVTDITSIRFDSLSTLDSEYHDTTKRLSSGIKVYQSAGIKTAISFVFGTINAPTYSPFLFSSNSTTPTYLTNLTSLEFNNFNTSNVTYMAAWFKGLSGLKTLDLSCFETSKVEGFNYMFENCTNLESIIWDKNKFDTSSLTTMYYMFAGCSSLKSVDLSKFNTAKVTTMERLFYGCGALANVDVSSFDTSSVKIMTYMFCKTGLTSIDLSHFKTTKVTSMGGMFEACSKLKSVNLSGLTNDALDTMMWMFSGCSALEEVNFTNFKTPKLTSLQNTFASCTSLKTLDLSSFTTNLVTEISRTFSQCTALKTLDLSNFNLSAVTGYTNTLYNCTGLTQIKAPSMIKSGVEIALPTSKSFYLDGAEVVTSITNAHAGHIIYDHVIAESFTASWQSAFDNAAVSGIANAQAITEISFEKTQPSGYTFAKYLNGTKIKIYTNGTKVAFVHASIKAPAGSCSYLFSSSTGNQLTKLQKIAFNGNFDTSEVTSMGGLFQGCTSLTSVDCGNFNTSKVSAMWFMFYDCMLLTSIDVSNFDTSNVTNMKSMFGGCTAVTSLNVSNFNTAKVSSMESMFNGCKALTELNLSSFNTAKVTIMSDMLSQCSKLTSIDVSNFDTSLVTNMSNMFNGCSSLRSINLSGLNTAKVTTMNAMLANCTSLKSANLSGFANNMLTNMNRMFDGCSALESVNFSNFKTTNVTSVTDMFSGCSKITNLDLSSFNLSKATTGADTMLTGLTGLTQIKAPSAVGTALTLPTGKSWYVEGTGSKITTIANVSTTLGKTIYDHVINETATFDTDWKTTFASSGVSSSISSATAITSICFEKTQPSGYTDSGKTLPSGIKIFTNGTKVAFVYDKIIAPTDCSNLFASLSALTEISFNNFDTTNVENMYCFLMSCTALTSVDVSGFNTSKVENMAGFFAGCEAIKAIDISNFDTSLVTNMMGMFQYCEAAETIKFDKSKFKTSKVTNMYCMFASCKAITSIDVSGFNTSSVETMYGMFNCCEKLKVLDLSNFDTSLVTNMNSMFVNCSELTTLNVTSFNTEKVTIMSSMFNGCSLLSSIDVSNFNTALVESLSSMFSNCSSLRNINLSGFNTAKVTTMDNMFANCTSLKSVNLSGFANSVLTRMNQMFNGCSALESVNFTNFKTANVTQVPNMFSGCSKITNLDLSSMNFTKSLTGNTTMLTGLSGLTQIKAPSATVSALTLPTGKSWYVEGAGSAITTIANVSTTLGKTIYDHLLNATATFDTNWKTTFANSAVSSSLSSADAITSICFETPASVSEYTDSGKTLPSGIKIFTNGTKVAFVYDKIYAPTSCANLFEYLTALEEISFNNFDTANTTNMSWMFNSAKLKSIDCSKFNTAKVTNMAAMFYGTKVTNLDLSNFNTAKVSSMSYLFNGCSSLKTLDLSSFTTTSVTTMTNMFYNCSALTNLNITSFTTTNVNNMSYMFNGCSSLTNLNLSSFNTAKVTTMERMFYACTSLVTLDISNFKTSLVTTMSYMFYNCNKMVNLNFSGATGEKLTTIGNIFDHCSSLKSVNFGSLLSKATSSLKTVSNMFYYCSALKLDLVDLSKTGATTLSSMFFNCSSITELKVIANNATNVTNMFYGCSKITKLDLSEFNCASVTSGNTTMLTGLTGLTELIAPKNISASYQLTLYSSKAYYVDGLASGVISGKKLTNTHSGKTIYTSIKSAQFDSDWRNQVEDNNIETSRLISITFIPYDQFSEYVSNLTYKFDLTSGIKVYVYNNNGTENSTILAFYYPSITAPTDCTNLFANLTSLGSIELGNFDTSNTTNMSGMFRGCVKLSDFGETQINTAKVTNTSYMFSGVKDGVSSPTFNFMSSTASVTNAAYMFSGYQAMTLYLNWMNVSKVTNITGFITECFNLTTIYAPAGIRDGYKISLPSFKKWTVEETSTVVTTLGSAQSSKTIRGGVLAEISSSWKTEIANLGVDGISSASNITVLRLDSPKTVPNSFAKTGKQFSNGIEIYQHYSVKTQIAFVADEIYTATSAEGLFKELYVTKIIINNINTSRTTDMSFMFGWGHKLTSIEGLSKFNTSKVTSTAGMFTSSDLLTEIDVSSFDMSKVTNVTAMFMSCRALKCLDLSSWTLTGGLTTTSFVNGCSSLECFVAPKYTGSVPEIILPDVFIDAQTGAVLMDSSTNKGILNSASHYSTTTQNKTYVIEYIYNCAEGGVIFDNTWKDEIINLKLNGISSLDNITKIEFITTLQIYQTNYASESSDYKYVKVGTLSSGINVYQKSTNPTEIAFAGKSIFADVAEEGLFSNLASLTSITFINFDTSITTSMRRWFAGNSSLATLDLSGLDTTKVTDISGMFNSCSKLVNLTVFSTTTKVTKIAGIFSGCISLKTLDLSDWHLDEISFDSTGLKNMLKECTGLTKIIAPYIPLIRDEIVNGIQTYVNIELPPTSGNLRWATPTGSGGYYTFNEISYNENGWTMELINPFYV